MEWRKSSFSNGTGGSNCVEVGRSGEDILVRDSKQNGTDAQPCLSFTPDEWRAFIAGVKAGEFDG